MAKFKIDVNEKKKEKIPFKFNIPMLNSLIGFVLKNTKQITRKSLNNLKHLMEIVDDNIYEGNDKIEARIGFIKRALKARLDLGMENEDVILNYCNTEAYSKENEEIIKNVQVYKRLNYEEIKSINQSVQDKLEFAYLHYYKEKVYAAWEKLDSGNFESYREINEEVTQIMTKFLNEKRKVRVIDDTDTFSLDPETFDDSVTDIVNKLKDPSRAIVTGIQALNKILSPALLSKRVYAFMGLPAGFKSGILLKLLYDCKKYNKHLPSRKPGKRKTAVLITMENSVEESVERLFNMTVTPSDIREYTPKQVIKMLKEEGKMVLKDDEDIDIVIKYYPNRSIDTSDLYTILDDLEDEGREIIMMVLDYIKRIRPAEFAKDEKEELKNITNELKTLANRYDIPVVTAHQLNRSAAAVVDAAMTSGKEDLARFTGRSNVGSAWEVMENVDWGCIINVEKKRETGQYYLTFKRVKIRYRDAFDLSYFNHPFEIGNRIRLMDDVHLDTPLSEESLSSDFEGVVDIESLRGKRQAKKREVIEDNDDQIFDFDAHINKRIS